MAPVLADSMSSKDPLIELRPKTLETSPNTLAETQTSNLKQITNVASGSNAIALPAPNNLKKDPEPSKNGNPRRDYAPCSYCNRPGHFWRICRVKQRDDEIQRRRTQNHGKRRFTEFRFARGNELSGTTDKKPAVGNNRPERSREPSNT